MKNKEELEFENFFKAGRPSAPPPKADEFQCILKGLEPSLNKAQRNRTSISMFAAAAAFCVITITGISLFQTETQTIQNTSIPTLTTNRFIEEDVEENLDQPSMNVGEEFLLLSDNS